MKDYQIAIVGATGAVGTELLSVLENRNFPVAGLRLIGSQRSVGKTLAWKGTTVPVEALGEDSFQGIDIAFFSAGSGISKSHAPRAKKAGAIVIDNSPAFRMDDDVPLVIPEINPGDAQKHSGIISNPNCTAAVALMALYPLHRAFGVKRAIGASYQAVSGTGARAITELRNQVHAAVHQTESPPEVYPHPIAFNLLPHIGSFAENGYTSEEDKLESEGRKIMHTPDFKASITCVRVPIYRAHSIALSAEFEKPVSLDHAREALAKAPGLELVDEPNANRYPMPLFAAGRDACQVGRVRIDRAFENGLSFWVSGDQLLKGAALNAVQIAELL